MNMFRKKIIQNTLLWNKQYVYQLKVIEDIYTSK